MTETAADILRFLSIITIIEIIMFFLFCIVNKMYNLIKDKNYKRKRNRKLHKK